MNAKAPWALFKEGGSAAEDAAQHLTVILEAVRIVAVALSPVVPEFCSRIYLQLGYSEAGALRGQRLRMANRQFSMKHGQQTVFICDRARLRTAPTDPVSGSDNLTK